MKSSWVYILKCSDGAFYTGCTTNLSQRLSEHNDGRFPGYTSKRRPIHLVWQFELPDINQAIRLERQLKGWSRRKKEALIKGDIELLHELAQSKEMRKRREKRPRLRDDEF